MNEDVTVAMWLKALANSIKSRIPQYVDICGHSQEEVDEQIKDLVDDCIDALIGNTGTQERKKPVRKEGGNG